jgi:hypothetical protein
VAGGAAGGPAEGQYLVATSGSPFPVPHVRVFSVNKANGTSAQDNYAHGVDVSANYGSPVLNADGTILVPAPNNANLADPTTQPDADILLSVDYDVQYIGQGNVPPNYASNPTLVGARPNRILDFPTSVFLQKNLSFTPDNSVTDATDTFIADRTFTTPAFSPNDSLLVAVEQASFVNTVVQTPFPALFAINEQEGDNLTPTNSRIRWRFPIFNDFQQGTTGLTPARNIEDLAIVDTVPLRNYLVFNNQWPNVDRATQLNTPEGLQKIHMVGSPIVTNDGVTYCLATAVSAANNTGRPLTVLMAFRTDPNIVLTLPEPFDTSAGVTLLQSDLTSDKNTPGVVRASTNQPNGQQFLLDGDRGRITILNFRVGTNSFSASQSFVVRYRPKNGAQERRIIIPPVPQTGDATNYGQAVDATGRITQNTGGFTPMLWYYVLPGMPRCQPTLIGDYIYYTAQIKQSNGTTPSYVIALDARPADLDPAVRVGFSEPVPHVTTNVVVNGKNQTPAINHVRMVQRLIDTNTTTSPEAPPVGSGDSLVVNSNNGTFDYQTGVTLVADSKRLIEVGADASALWTLDSTVEATVAGGQLPVYGINGAILNQAAAVGRTNVRRLGFARPQAVQRIGDSDYLIADTGNNRIIRTDRSGQILWSLTRVADPNSILAGGETTTLSQPTDVQYYTIPTLNNGQVSGYEIHYLVADAGNFRVIEVADYYNSTGNPIGATASGEHTVVWVTRTTPGQGRKLRYESIQRFTGFGPPGTQYEGYFGYPYVTAIVSNSNAGTGGTADVVGGALVSLSYAPFNTSIPMRAGGPSGNAAPVVLWSGGTPASATEPTGNGTVLTSFTDINILNGGQRIPKKLNSPVFFQQLNLAPNAVVTTPRTLFLICDADGAYVVQNRLDNNNNPVRDVLWQFTQADYDHMNTTPLVGNDPTTSRLRPTGGDLPRFVPTSIQVLASGNYLITNSYVGRTALFDTGQFNGEAFEVRPPAGALLLSLANFKTTIGGGGPVFGFAGTFDSFSVPKLLRGSDEPPVTLNRQVMGNPQDNTGLVEQPLSAVRP